MDTWGISGPGFLVLYLVLLTVTVAGVVVARRRVLGHRRGRPCRTGWTATRPPTSTAAVS
jgi:hypothetical protein